MNDNYKAAYERQKIARARAEELLESRSRELYDSNESLRLAYNQLKTQKAQLVHQEKLASIGQLSAGVAHEVNNPAGYVKSNLSTLKDYVGKIQKFIEDTEALTNEPSDIKEKFAESKKRLDIDYIQEDIGELINDAIDGMERVSSIVKALKDFSRPDTEKPQCFSLNECIQNTIKIIHNEIKYKSELKLELGDIPEIHGQPGSMGQVVLNLLVNASHSIATKGNIELKTYLQVDKIYLSIKDNGCGIKDENLAKIFDPFFTTKEVGQGTGLGLSIVQNIVRKHKGNIHVDSEIGQGTTFTISLPVPIECEAEQ
jgi:two-component system NtrC family sensor kinase